MRDKNVLVARVRPPNQHTIPPLEVKFAALCTGNIPHDPFAKLAHPFADLTAVQAAHASLPVRTQQVLAQHIGRVLDQPCHDGMLDVDGLAYVDLEGVTKSGKMVFPLLDGPFGQSVRGTLPWMGGLRDCDCGFCKFDLGLWCFNDGYVTLFKDEEVVNGI